MGTEQTTDLPPKTHLTRPEVGQSLAEFRAQLPIIVVTLRDTYPATVTEDSPESEIKRPTWIVAGERHISHLSGKEKDALDFYVDHGFEILAILEVAGVGGVELFYSVKVPTNGSIGICREPSTAFGPSYLVHDHMGTVLATSKVNIRQGEMGGRFATGYLIETQPNGR